MSSIRFKWDRKKAAKNIKRHQIAFEEATSVFYDRLAIIFEDEAHSEQELRELIIGYSSQNRLLIVVFTERNNAVRLISARRANAVERVNYEKARR